MTINKTAAATAEGKWAGWLVGWSVGWSVGWLIDWLVGSLVGWFVRWLVGWFRLNGRPSHRTNQRPKLGFGPGCKFRFIMISAHTAPLCRATTHRKQKAVLLQAPE